MPYSLTSNILTSIYVDKTNNLWTGTYGAGLNKYTIRRPAFTSFTSGLSTLNSLSGKFVFGIREAEDSSVYVSFYDSPGFSIIDKERSNVTNHAPAYIKTLLSLIIFILSLVNKNYLANYVHRSLLAKSAALIHLYCL